MTVARSKPARNLLCTALLAGVCLPPAQAQHRRESQMTPGDGSSLKVALEAYDAGDSASARPVLETLLGRYPDNYFINEGLGSLYAEAGDTHRALPLLEHAVLIAPEEPVAHSNLGALDLKLGRRAQAVTQLRLAAKLAPQEFANQANLGRALMLSHQPGDAAVAFAAAAKLKTGDTDTLYNWALALEAAGQPREAAAVLAQLAPAAQTAESASLAGELAEQLGDFKTAVLDEQTAVRLDPTAQNVYVLTLELLRHWTWSEALQVAQFGQARFPADTRFAVAAGIAEYADEKYAAAAQQFSALLHAEPNNAGFADLLGRSCEAGGEATATTCGALDAFALAHPANARVAVFVAAGILRRPVDQQDTARADALLRQAIAADPRLPEAFYQQGVLAQQRGQWQASQTALEHAIALRPAYAEAHFRLSRAYAHLGRRDDAQREIALHAQYSQQDKDQLNAHLGEVVRFLLKPS